MTAAAAMTTARLCRRLLVNMLMCVAPAAVASASALTAAGLGLDLFAILLLRMGLTATMSAPASPARATAAALCGHQRGPRLQRAADEVRDQRVGRKNWRILDGDDARLH